ncbi:MAG TPA: hypothetical protein VID27_14740, partial [Blastocatellia bacterium]
MKTKTPRISLTTRLALLMILSISFPSALEAQSGNQEKKPDEAQAYTETAGGAAIEMVLVPAGK